MEEDSSRMVDKDHTKLICICSANTASMPKESGLINSTKTIYDLVTSNNLITKNNILFFGPLSEISRTGETTYVKFNDENYTKDIKNDFFVTYDDSKSKSATTAMIIDRVNKFVTPKDLVHIFLIDHGNSNGLGFQTLIDCSMLLRFLLSLRVKGLRVYNCNGGLTVEAFSAWTELNKVAATFSITISKKCIEKCVNYLIKTPEIFQIGLQHEEIGESLNVISSIINNNPQALKEYLYSNMVEECMHLVEFFQSRSKDLYDCKSISDFRGVIHTLLSFTCDSSLRPFESLEELELALEKLTNVGIKSINEVKILVLFFESLEKYHEKGPINFADSLSCSFIPEMGTVFKTFAQSLGPCKLKLYIEKLESLQIVYQQLEPLADYKIISSCGSNENGHFSLPATVNGSTIFPGTIGVEAFIKEIFVESKDGRISVERIQKSIPPAINMTPKCIQSGSTSKDSFTLLFESSKVPATIEDLLISSGFRALGSKPAVEPVELKKSPSSNSCDIINSSSEKSEGEEEEEEFNEADDEDNQEEEEEFNEADGEDNQEEEEEFNEADDDDNQKEYKALLPYVETVRELFRLYNEHLKTKNLEFDPFTYPYQRFVGESHKMRSIIKELDKIHPTAYILLILEPCLDRLLHFMTYNTPKDEEISTVFPKCYRKALEFAKAKGYTIL